MPLPCNSEIFSSSVNRLSTMSARSSGDSVRSIHGKFGLPSWPELGGCADAVEMLRSNAKIAKTVTREQNRLFIGYLDTSVHQIFTYHDTSRWRIELTQ